jgi:hypothetical protein
MDGAVAHAGGGAAAEGDGGRARCDAVGGSDANADVAHNGGGLPADEDGGASGSGNQAPDVGDWRDPRGDEGADVHVSEASGWLTHF